LVGSKARHCTRVRTGLLSNTFSSKEATTPSCIYGCFCRSRSSYTSINKRVHTWFPLNALNVSPTFSEYHFIDINQARIEALQQVAQQRTNVFVHDGDCNQVLLREVFPRVLYKDFRRGLCLQDPYGLHLDWQVIYTAGQMKSVEIFLNFPIMDMNMNVLKHNQEAVPPEQAERMTRFWGDESWKSAAYSTSGNLFGYEEKTDNEAITKAFRERLLSIAGFKHVSQPLAMRNSRDAVVYYLFFASPKPVAERIVKDIFTKHGKRL
jgi:three-Cys-motif partner protein